MAYYTRWRDLANTEWPENLLLRLGITDISPVRRLGLEGELEIAMILARLLESERKVIRLRYVQGKGLQEISDEMGIGSKQAADEKDRSALDKLTAPGSDSLYILQNGLDAWLNEQVNRRFASLVKRHEALLSKEDKRTIERVGGNQRDAALNTINLSVRAYNALRNAGIERLGDLDRLNSWGDLKSLRNVGSGTAMEIINALRAAGLPYEHLLTGCQSTKR